MCVRAHVYVCIFSLREAKCLFSKLVLIRSVAESCLTFCHPWTGFSRKEYWNGLPFSSPGDLSDPGVEPQAPALQADSLPCEPPEKPL